MSIDRNGRAHKPKGLPQHQAGAYERSTRTNADNDLQSDDPWAVDPDTPIDPDMFDTTRTTQTITPTTARRRGEPVIPDDAPAWDGPDITIRMIADYAPVSMDADDIQPATINITRDHAHVTIHDRSDTMKRRTITMPTPAGMRNGDRLAWDGRRWRILKRGPNPQPHANTPRRPARGRQSGRPPAGTPAHAPARHDDANAIRRRRLLNAGLVFIRGLAAAVRRGLRGR